MRSTKHKKPPPTRLPDFFIEQVIMDPVPVKPFGGLSAKDLAWSVKQEHDFIEKILNNCSDEKKTLPYFDNCVPVLRQYFIESKQVVKGAGTRVFRGEQPERMSPQIVFVEPSWSAESMCRQIMRVYNHTQAMPVRVRVLSLKDTVDVRIGKLLIEEVKRILKVDQQEPEPKREFKVLSSIDPSVINKGPPTVMPPEVEKVLRERGIIA